LKDSFAVAQLRTHIEFLVLFKFMRSVAETTQPVHRPDLTCNECVKRDGVPGGPSQPASPHTQALLPPRSWKSDAKVHKNYHVAANKVAIDDSSAGARSWQAEGLSSSKGGD